MGRSGFSLLTRVILGALACGISSSLHAQVLSEKQVLARCYAQLTGVRLAPGNPLWKELARQRAIPICLDLLEKTKFNAQGVIDASSPTQVQILKQFHDFHRSWMPKQFQNQNELGDSMHGTVDIHDPSESALHITRALFTDGYHYRGILRGHESLEALRNPASANGAGSPTGVKRVSRAFLGAYDGDANFNFNAPAVVIGTHPIVDQPPYALAPVPLLQVGTMLGVGVRSDLSLIPNMLTRHGPNGGVINEAGLDLPHALRKNYGGGALGTQGLLLYSFGYGFDYMTNGTNLLPRTWMVHAFKSFLCKEGPYLLPSDVSSFVRTGGNAPAFRGQTSCLQCHVALDQAALTARNLVPATTSYLTSTTVRSTASVASYKVLAGAEPGQEFWPSQPASTFRFQAPAGKLHFRSFEGHLIQQNVSNMNELGTALSETNDFYACASKRYVEYFMGIKVPLEDSGERSADDPTWIKEKAWRDFIVALGKELRQTGSLKILIKRILESDHYRMGDFGR